MVTNSYRGIRGHVLVERIAFFGAVLASFAALGCGLYFARRLNDPHWMNRAGAAVVAIQVIAGAAEFARRKRLQRLQSSGSLAQGGLRTVSRQDLSPKMRDILEEEVAKSETQAFGIALSLAAIGEIFHGFGDLLFKLIFNR